MTDCKHLGFCTILKCLRQPEYFLPHVIKRKLVIDLIIKSEGRHYLHRHLNGLIGAEQLRQSREGVALPVLPYTTATRSQHTYIEVCALVLLHAPMSRAVFQSRAMCIVSPAKPRQSMPSLPITCLSNP